jgi:hypothetical protein
MNKLIAFIFITLLCFATTTTAAPLYLDFAPTWQLTDSDYFTITDHTTGGPGNALFELEYERTLSWYNSSFGIYSLENGVIHKVEIFDVYSQPGLPNPSISVFLKQIGETWEIAINNGNYAQFSNTFGFYFDVYTNVVNPSYSYTWFTDQSLNRDANGNPVDTNIDHIAVAYNNSMADAYIFLDASPGDADHFNSSVVHGSDLAPVPLMPAIYFFSIGILGLISLKKRK